MTVALQNPSLFKAVCIVDVPACSFPVFGREEGFKHVPYIVLFDTGGTLVEGDCRLSSFEPRRAY